MTEEETKTEETKSDDESKSEEPKPAEDSKPDDKAELKVEAKPAPKPTATATKTTSKKSTTTAPPRKPTGWRPSWYRVGMGDLFIGIALLIAGTVVAMRTPTRWYGAFIVGTIETVHGLYLLSKKKQS